MENINFLQVRHKKDHMLHHKTRLKNKLEFMLIFGCVSFLAVLLRAADRYVVEPGTIADGNGGIYTSWDIAATQIQWAVAAAESNATIFVSNGTYVLTNQIRTVYGTNITIRSVNGRTVTIVDGNREISSNRCFDLFTNATLDGFTVRNGCAISARGGGVNASASKIYNCRIENNVCSNNDGGGVSLSVSTITNCQIVGNVSTGGSGAGVYAYYGNIYACEIASNLASGTEVYGIGARASQSTISNCTIYANRPDKCTNPYGGGICTYYNTTVRNCLIYGNRADKGGGGIWVYPGEGYTYITRVQNCTIVSNYATGNGSGIFISGYYGSTNYVENTISYYNTGCSDSNLFYASAHTGMYIIAYSCIAPTSAVRANNNSINILNIQTDPKFVNYTNGNCRLKTDSPCINNGTNQSWMTNANDLGGTQRIRYGTVDMGAYERVNEGTIYTVH